MPVISDEFPSNTDNIEEKLRKTDFSKYTNLKTSLAEKLFKIGDAVKKSSPTLLSDEEAELVNAALGLDRRSMDQIQSQNLHHEK